MNHFICPVCGRMLHLTDKAYVCENRHSYDVARQGYVNLLMSQQSGKKRHGDDKLMIRSRQAFLEKGYYSCLLNEVIKICRTFSAPRIHIVDVGCGEGWYSDKIYRALSERSDVQMEGIDISKDALGYAARRNPEIAWAVASTSKLPIESGSCDILINLFAPLDEKEFARIVKPGGLYLRAIALERHLWGLKQLIYERPYDNQPAIPELAGFSAPGRTDIRRMLSLEQQEDIMNLFKMTPYYYKTSEKDQKKLENVHELQTPLEFSVLTYRRII